MAEQLTIKFSDNLIEQVNIFRNAKGESKTASITHKLKPSQKLAIKTICTELEIDVSGFVNEAVEQYIDLFPYRKKMIRHHRLLRSFLDSLS